MGRQSARIVRKGIDHKDIVGGKFNHVQLWHKGELVWEKLPDSGYQGFKISTSAPSYSYKVCSFFIAGDFTVDWGDGTKEEKTINELTRITHTYPYERTSIIYTATFKGNISDISFKACENMYEILTPLPPSLSEKTDFSSMFAYIDTGLRIPNDLFMYCTNAESFDSCFYSSVIRDSEGRSAIPEGLFEYNINAKSFLNCFANSGFVVIPDGLFENKTLVTNFGNCFYNMPATKIPSNLFKNCVSAETLGGCFSFGDYYEVPEGLFDDMPYLKSVRNCFIQCTNIKSVPYELFDNNNKLEDVYRAFFRCDAITSKIPPLWEREWEDVTKYKGCYYNCRNAENYSDIPNAAFGYWTDDEA